MDKVAKHGSTAARVERLDGDAIRAHLRGKLAAYKVPRHVLFFSDDEVSYTGNQKVQVEPLRQAALERLAAEGVEIDGHRYGATT